MTIIKNLLIWGAVYAGFAAVIGVVCSMTGIPLIYAFLIFLFAVRD